jgi:hypothetical protein
LQATDIVGSMDTIGIYDGTITMDNALFSTEQLAPDGKIYMSTGNGDTVCHIINYPDLKGDSCNFIQHGIRLPSICVAIPNFPNYRLGPLRGSPCDTLSTSNSNLQLEKEKILKVFPNPASSEVVIDYGFTDWSKGEVSLQISNELGQIFYTQKLPMYSGLQKIDVSKFPVGLYAAFIQRNNSVVAASKFVKE